MQPVGGHWIVEPGQGAELAYAENAAEAFAHTLLGRPIPPKPPT